ncbi:MAG: aspartate--tRNA(Asn) ligase [Bacillota bacterium]
MERALCSELPSHVGEEVVIRGWAHRVRNMGKFRFILVRDRSGIVQVVAAGDLAKDPDVSLETALEVEGKVVPAPATELGCEIQASGMRLLSAKPDVLPFEVNLPSVETGLENMLDHRVLSLRNPRTRAAFTVQSEILEGFRQFLRGEGFTEVQTPKIVATGTEGGAELFPVRYFEKPAYLAQSPQFYKQMLVGSGFERVYEIGHVFRAERHNTSRHLNEFVSLDLEMGFIDGLEDLLRLEERLLDRIFRHLEETCSAELKLCGAALPAVGSIPRLKVSEIAQILKREYGKELPDGSLDTEGERLIGEYAETRLGSPFVFATHYPATARPMYSLPDPEDPSITHTFDLLFKGMEMNSGGMRINDHRQLSDNMRKFGLDPKDFESYLEVFRYGMPPHGGFAIGLERLTVKALGLENIREASLFPRDRDRLSP